MSNLKPIPEPIKEEVGDDTGRGEASPLQNQYLGESPATSGLTSSYHSSDYTASLSKSPESQQKSPSDMFSYSNSELAQSNPVQLQKPYVPDHAFDYQPP